MKKDLSTEDLANFCKTKGFIFPDSEIYGGLAGFWDLGPLGVELYNNIKANWWKHFVQDKENMTGIDGSIISHPRTWKASGHLESFGDVMVECKKCNERSRADHLIEEQTDLKVEGLSAKDLNKIIKENKIKCPNCDSTDFGETKTFNLLFKTSVGSVEGEKGVAYLRGETAQAMFMNFKNVAETARKQLPFGIAQVGKCFRNEISPRDFIFRSREFTIAEFEFFIHPDEKKCNLLTKKHLDTKLNLLDAETQEKELTKLKETTVGQMLKEKRLGEWHAYWLAEQMFWYEKIGLNFKNIKVRQHTKDELSHYSSATYDIDYLFPFGSKEIAGNANRGQYDLTQHIKESKKKLEIFDEESKKSVIPRVIEPTFGIERTFLAVITNGYNYDEKRGNIVLSIKPNLAPVKLGIFPLVNKLKDEAKEVYEELKEKLVCQFDTSGSVGRRYARADEIGIPFCITIDFDCKKNKDVTIRDRESTKQIRVKKEDLIPVLNQLINQEISFEKAGTLIKGQ